VITLGRGGTLPRRQAGLSVRISGCGSQDVPAGGAATAQVGAAAALAWRDYMVSGYSDAGQERSLAGEGIDLLRGTGRLAGPGVVEVDGVRHTATHVVVATGSDPVVPPIPGLRELEGVWTNREVTGMKAVPRRLLILGGGPVGAEMARAVCRLGGEVALIEAAPHVLAREPAPLGEALGEDLDKHRGRLRATLPIGRVIGPADVAALAVHLMTNTAITGATYDIDGGQQLIPGR